MRVVENAFRGEVRAERGPLMVAHPGVIVGLGAPVQLPDRRDPRSGGRQMGLVNGSKDRQTPLPGDPPGNGEIDINPYSPCFPPSSLQHPSNAPVYKTIPSYEPTP